jgi:methyltransferase (TIGR00027 family)
MPRTDNDTWDLASSVGVTATMVAAARAVATNADEPLIDDPFAEPLVRAVGVDFLTRWATGELTTDAIEGDDQGFGLRNMPQAMAARTRYFDAFFADAAAAGIRQAVILASGLDARAYRLSWPDGMTVFELDQPEVIEFKTTTLAGLGAAPTTERRTVAIDLRDDWPAALKAAGFDPSQPSAWIAEGLLGYLPPEAQDQLLDAVTELGAPGSRLATETIPHNPDVDVEAAREKMRESSAKWRDHGFDIDFSELGFEGERNEVGAYLDARGWRSLGVSMGKLLSDFGFPSMPRQDDGTSTMADVVYYTSILAKS